MDWIAKLLANPSTVLYLVITLFVLTVIFTLKFRSVVKRSKLLLIRGAKILDEAANKEEFVTKYGEIADKITKTFSKNRPLSQQWERFQTQLTSGGDKTICSYFEPDKFFNSSLLLKDKWLPLCKAGPSYLVGIGLVFTFLGIAVVIYRASLALGTGNDLQALRDLLGAASLKFWTSLVGVGLSVLSSGYFRHLTARFNLAASDFCYSLSMRVFFLSQEYSLQLSNSLLSRQLEAVSEMRNALILHQKESSAEIIKELKTLGEGMTSVTENTFSELVEKSTSQLSSALSNSLRDVAQTFVSINSDLKLTSEQIQHFPDDFKVVAEHLQSTGRSLLDDLEKAKASSNEIAAEFGRSSESSSRIKDSLSPLPESISKVVETLESLGELQNVSQKLHEAAAAVRASSDALLANWQQQAGHVSSIDEKLAATVTKLPLVFVQYSESLQKFTDEFDNHLGRVLGSLALQVESLETSQHSLRGIAETLHASINNGSSDRTAESL